MTASHTRPIVHFVGSIPASRFGNRIPHLERGDRSALAAPARRRDRHPPHLDPLSAGRPRRKPGHRGGGGRAALQVHPMGRQGPARNPAASRQTRRHARLGRLQDRLRRDGDRLLGAVRAPAEGGGHSGGGEVPGLASDADRADLQQHGAVRSARDLAGADPASHRRGREDRRARCPTTASHMQWDVCQEVLAWEGYYDRAQSISAARPSMS